MNANRIRVRMAASASITSAAMSVAARRDTAATVAKLRSISAPTSLAPKDIAVLIMEMISAANAQEVATDRIVIKCHERTSSSAT